MDNTKMDRRVERTRIALLTGFSELILSGQRYDEIRVSDVIGRANVGRSTFYEHFKNKEEILAASMRPMLATLAAAVDDKQTTHGLIRFLDHVWTQRHQARAIFAGTTRRLIVRILSRMLMERLSRCDLITRKRQIDTRIAAAVLAEAQIGALYAWLTGEFDCASADFAATLLHVAQRVAI